MNENGKKKREWVKTAAIVFLSVMLVLTFFSNTIMNYSLPEVATQYVQSGTITAKIRGSGTVESGDPYNVEVKESRKVSGVAVHVGDTVQQGDVLVYLEDQESEELKTAKEALETLQAEYEKAIVSADTSKGIVNRVESGNVTSTDSKLAQIDSYNKKIEQLEGAIKNYNNRIAEIEAELSKLGENTVDTSVEELQVNATQAELEKAAAAVPAAKEKLEAAQSVLESVNSAVKAAEERKAACEAARSVAMENHTAMLNRLNSLNEKNAAGSITSDEQIELDRLSGDGEGSVTAASAVLADAETALQEATTALENVNASIVADREKAQNEINARQAEYNSALDAQTTWEGKVAEAKRNLANKQATKPDNSHRDALTNEKADLTAALGKSNTEKSDAEKALTELLAGFAKEVDLSAMLKKIQDQKKSGGRFNCEVS